MVDASLLLPGRGMKATISISGHKGIVGTASPVLGVVTSFQEQIEWHLRITSLLVGLGVGVLSLSVPLSRRCCRSASASSRGHPGSKPRQW